MESRGYDFSKIILPTTGIGINESDCVHYMECLKTLDLSTFNPPSWLQHTETPFKWAQILNPKKIKRCHTDLKLNDYPEEDEDGCYTYEKFCLHIVRIFQNSLINEHEIAKQNLQKLKDFIQAVSEHRADVVYNRIGHALEHVLLAVTAQVLLLNGDITEEESQNIGSSLMSFSQMKPETKAGIEAIKARFYIACSTDKEDLAMKHIKEAKKLDPEFAPWLYWTGKITRKIRKRENKKNPEEEISFFESALEKIKDPKYILFLAQGYREKAQYLFHEQKSSECKNNEEINNLGISLKLYKECWELKKDSAAINRRLGNGVKSLNKNYADYKLAEDCLMETLNLSTNPVTFHRLGLFYSYKKKDHQKSVEYFIKGAEHGLIQCFQNLVLLKYIFVPNYDPYEDLKKEEAAMEYSPDLHRVYADFGWYYLFFQKDLCKAVEYFLKVLEADADYLTRFWSYSFCVIKLNVNMYSILKDKIHCFQEENKGKNIDDSIFQKFLNKIEENPDLISKGNIVTFQYVIKRALSSKIAVENKLKITPQGNNVYRNNKSEGENYGRMKSSASNFSGKCNKETNWWNKPKETKTFNNTGRHSFQSQKYSKDPKISNWRSECKGT